MFNKAHSAVEGDLGPFVLAWRGPHCAAGDLEFASVPFEQRSSDFELVLSMGEAADGSLSASLQYNSDLFLPATIQRMAEHFVNILRRVVTGAQSSVLSLPMQSVSEVAMLRDEWTRTDAYYDPATTLFAMVEVRYTVWSVCFVRPCPY